MRLLAALGFVLSLAMVGCAHHGHHGKDCGGRRDCDQCCHKDKTDCNKNKEACKMKNSGEAPAADAAPSEAADAKPAGAN